MELSLDQLPKALVMSMAILFVFLFMKLLFSWWIIPIQRYYKLKRNGLKGPSPSFPLGNLEEMKKKNVDAAHASPVVSHNIHSFVFPYFAKWQKSHGKVFMYWLGTEPFLYIADPEFLKQMSSAVLAKRWGKPDVFKSDRDPMFGSGLVMVEGNDWVRHRSLIAPAFSPLNLKAMASLMVDTTNRMLDNWTTQVISGNPKIDVENEITAMTGEIISKTIFGITDQSAREVFDKLRALQMTLFKTNRYVGVPFGKYMNLKETIEAKKLGRLIDRLLLSFITSRKTKKPIKGQVQQDLLGLLMQENKVEGRSGKTLSTRELVDECKTFFFGGHETTALAITWTLLLLSMHQDWQTQLREEIKEVIGDGEMDIHKLAGLKKMNWVMNEVLRLYPPAPNVQRQAREDIQVGDLTIPNGNNMWIDVVSMHHDPALWGEDADEFNPERFKDDIHGGCKHKMGFLPFGFGGRMCIGRNLTFMEYKIVMSLILTRFSFSLSPSYCHSPSIMLSLRPTFGLPLIVQPLVKLN